MKSCLEVTNFRGLMPVFEAILSRFLFYFGLLGANWAQYGLVSLLNKRQFGYPHQIIGCYCQFHPKLIALGSLVP